MKLIAKILNAHHESRAILSAGATIVSRVGTIHAPRYIV